MLSLLPLLSDSDRVGTRESTCCCTCLGVVEDSGLRFDMCDTSDGDVPVVLALSVASVDVDVDALQLMCLVNDMPDDEGTEEDVTHCEDETVDNESD